MLSFGSGSGKKRLEEEVENLRNEIQRLYDQSEQLRNENERLFESHTTKSDELQVQKAQYQELRTHSESLGRELSGLLDEHEKLNIVGSRQSQELRGENEKTLQLANELLCIRVEHEIPDP
jgi:chromosome segregation ATPase